MFIHAIKQDLKCVLDLKYLIRGQEWQCGIVAQMPCWHSNWWRVFTGVKTPFILTAASLQVSQMPVQSFKLKLQHISPLFSETCTFVLVRKKVKANLIFLTFIFEKASLVFSEKWKRFFRSIDFLNWLVPGVIVFCDPTLACRFASWTTQRSQWPVVEMMDCARW